MDWLRSWFSGSGFMPHGHCYLWDPALVWLHVTTDTVIGIAYLSISLSLYLLVRKIDLPFSWVFVAFGIFIGACGLTHFMSVVTMWEPVYWVDGAVKFVTAAASIATAVLLFPLTPKVVDIARQAKLAEEHRLRLESHSAELERRVNERTAELQAALRSEKYTRALFQAVIENSPLGIALFDTHVRFTHVNPTLAALNGLPPAEHIGRKPTELLPGVDDIARIEQAMHQVCDTGAPMLGVELAGETPAHTGERRIWSENFFPIKVDDKLEGIAVIVQDVTERRLAEERARLIAEAIPSIVRITDPQGNVLYFNRRWYEFTGATPEQSFGTAWFALVHPEDRPHTEAAWKHAMSSVEPLLVEYRVRTRDGGYRWLMSHAVPILGDDGRPVNWYGVATDIDEQKRAIMLRDEFLSFASHELRTPLSAFSLRIETLQRLAATGRLQDQSGEKLAGALDATAKQVRRLAALTDQLLDVSRFTTGQIRLDLRATKVVAAVRDISEQFKELAAHDHGTAVRFENTLPEETTAELDPERFAQLVTNLLSNAFKFGAHKPIEVALAAVPDAFKLTVRDYGVGVAPDKLEMIFERFTRANTDRSISGLGLGLFIVKQIVDLHHGRIEVASRVGEGTTFSVTLPLRQPRV